MQATSSLTLRALFKSAITRTGLDRPARIVAGLSPAAQALAVVAHARATGGVVLVIVPTDKDVEQQLNDIRFFWGAIEGSDEHAIERAVLGFPSHQVDPYRGMTPHFRVAAARARGVGR